MDLTPEERKRLVEEAEQIQREYGALKDDTPEAKKKRLKIKNRYEEIDRLLGSSAARAEFDDAPLDPEIHSLLQAELKPRHPKPDSKEAVTQEPAEPVILESTPTEVAVKRKCPYCAGEIKPNVKKCLHCGEWLDRRAAQENASTQAKAMAKARSDHQGKEYVQGCLGCLGVSVILAVFVGSCVFFGDSNEGAVPSRKAASTVERSSRNQGPPRQRPRAESGYDTSDVDRRIYDEMMDAPMTESERQVHERLGRKYGKSPEEIDATVKRVLRDVYFGEGTETLESEVRDAVSRLALVKDPDLTVVGDFVNMSYVEDFPALNDAHIKRETLENMPRILAAIFSIKRVHKVRLIAFYPTTDGGEKRVAYVEVRRDEFSPQKRAQDYREFSAR